MYSRSQRVVLDKMNSYQYSPLQKDAQEIRLLNLLPGIKPAEFRICLKTVALTSESALPYEALSYTWGPTDNPISVRADCCADGTLAVTRNLAEALGYLRYSDKPRLLWIDAICINQQDPDERSGQVELMADIYNGASRVIIWLGPESRDSSIALDCIDILSRNVAVDRGRRQLSSTSEEHHWSDRDTVLPFDEFQFNSIYTLFHRPWFERLWIWQEVHQSRHETLVMVGSRTLPWESIRTTVFCLVHKCQPPFDITGQTKMRVIEVEKLCIENNFVFLPHLIEFTKRSLCSDPRDRIYAILSLLTPGERDYGIRPDYNKSVTAVYEDTMVRWTRLCQNLTLLQTAELSEDTPRIPSWVPDWSAARSTFPLANCHASAYVANTLFSFQDGVMEALGASIDVIEYSNELELPEIMSTTARDNVLTLAGQDWRLRFRDYFVSSKSSLSTFCKVICSNCFSDFEIPPSPTAVTLLQAEEILRRYIDPELTVDAQLLYPEYRVFFRTVFAYCQNRSLVRTKNGHLALGPRSALAGDLIVVLLNGEAPMILRPMEQNQFCVVGEAYCHGFMDREALLGPLPASLRLVKRYDEQNAILWFAHLDQKSGQFLCEDPRLGPLPHGWTRKSHPSESFHTCFVHEDTGQEMSHGFDPRLTVEAFRARDVELRTFAMV